MGLAGMGCNGQAAPGMKLQFVDPCGPSCSGSGACFCLEDDSKMHMDLYRDPPELDESGSQNILCPQPKY
jgi:hypothetical protein